MENSQDTVLILAVYGADLPGGQYLPNERAYRDSVRCILVLLHLWNICERNKFLVFGTLFVYVAAFIANIICTALAVSYLPNNASYSTVLRICAMQSRKGVPMVWAPGLALDTIIIPTVMYNALERPRDSRTELHSQIFRDGLFFFVVSPQPASSGQD
ncbi:hypothetical protein VKT23_015725 [Stygiomarasmius scandens]|uniref:Uncharacterized protein n=1 Tax=Marasmiellus scandens TaxID=2682957 RepID=A0ABR1J1L4_9AGAR